MKTAASTHGQIDGWSIVIRVVVVSSRWSCNDGGESHGARLMLMEMACLKIVWGCLAPVLMVVRVHMVVRVQYRSARLDQAKGRRLHEYMMLPRSCTSWGTCGGWTRVVKA
jgi:hypothetical protein